MKTAIIVTVLAAIVFVVWWFFLRIARPKYPPLWIAPDDPLMTEATRKAKDTIFRLRELYSKPHQGANVKVPFVTSSGVTEYLWAEVLSIEDGGMEVRYQTPPVTHTGKLERVHKHPLSDIVDWVIQLPCGKYAGGYTMRIMFIRGREQWGRLPAKLEAEEKKYVD
jgi:uncharacterized protein YegJ (DUF2314 family)